MTSSYHRLHKIFSYPSTLFAGALSLCLFAPQMLHAATVSFNFSADPTNEGSGVYRYSDVDDLNTLDMILTVTGSGADSGTPSLVTVNHNSTSNSARVAINDAPSENPWLTFSIKFITADSAATSAAQTINSLRVQGFDIDGDPVQDFTDIFGYSNSLSPSVQLTSTTNLEQGGWVSGGASGFTTYRAQQVSSNWGSGVPNISNTATTAQQDYTVDFLFSNFTEGDFVIGITGPDTGNRERGFFMNMSNPPYITVVPEPGSFATLSMLIIALGTVTMLRRRSS